MIWLGFLLLGGGTYLFVDAGGWLLLIALPLGIALMWVFTAFDYINNFTHVNDLIVSWYTHFTGLDSPNDLFECGNGGPNMSSFGHGVWSVIVLVIMFVLVIANALLGLASFASLALSSVAVPFTAVASLAMRRRKPLVLTLKAFFGGLAGMLVCALALGLAQWLSQTTC